MPTSKAPATTAPVEDARAGLRAELADLTAYVPSMPEGIEVKLDANEAPPVEPELREIVARAMAAVPLEVYPDPRAERLRAAISARTGAPPGDLLVGTGSDEVISLIVNAFAQPRRKNTQAVVLAPTPSFVMYRVTARAHGVKPVELPLDAAWDLDAKTMSRAIEMMSPNVVFIASPNNPTGNVVSRDRLEAVLEQAKGAFVVVDEAYVDYAPGSVRELRARHANLGVLRTLSKVGLAALRVGWLEAGAGLVGEIDKGRQPFNVSATSQLGAAAALEEGYDALSRGVARVREARDALARELDALEGFEVTPSDANFLWVRTAAPAGDVYEHLVREGVLVRSFHARGGRLAHQLRVTIGRPEDNARLLDALSRAPR